jgi:hypothetical protein
MLVISRNLVEANGGSIEVESPSTLRQAQDTAGLRAGEEGKGNKLIGEVLRLQPIVQM